MKTIFYTKKGDGGKSVINNSKISKDNLFFEFLGSLDELNSFLGITRALFKYSKSKIKIRKDTLETIILEIQEKIFRLQAEIAMDKFNYSSKNFKKINLEDISYMENLILFIDSYLDPLKTFIIPGESLYSSYLDYARSLSRRVERIAVKFLKKQNKKDILAFLNRLSSLLFALARYVNLKLKVKEISPSYK